MDTVVPVPGSSQPALAHHRPLAAPAAPHHRPRPALRRWADAGHGATPGEAPDDLLDHIAAALLCPARLLPVGAPATA